MGDPYRHEVCRLSSGAQLFHLERDLPWIGATFTLMAGCMHDPVGKEGVSHVLEHYLSGGSIGRLSAMSKEELGDWIEKNGMFVSLGETTPYWSRYEGRTLVGNTEALIQLLSDLAFRPGFDNSIEHDRGIVRAERDDRLSPRSHQLSTVMNRLYYGTHRRATITGLPEDGVLNAITQEDLLAFHQRYYGAPNLRIVTIGGASLDQVVSSLERNLPTRTHHSFEAVASVPPLPLEPFGTRVQRFKPLGDGAPVKAALRWVWKLPLGRFGIRSVTAQCLEKVLMGRVRERTRMVYSVRVVTGLCLDHVRFEIETMVAIGVVDSVRLEVEAALRDYPALLARIPHVRHTARMAAELADMTFVERLHHVSDLIATTGRIATEKETVAEIADVTEEAVCRFVQESLAVESSLLVIIES